MKSFPFTLENLKHFELGKVDEAFKQSLAACVKDCLSRPGLSDPRTVEMIFKVKPVSSDGGTCESAEVQVVLKTKTPAQQTREVDVNVRTNGSLVFHEMFDDEDEDAPLLGE